LNALKNSIHSEIVKLIEKLKNKLVADQNVEVVFSLSDFYLLEPSPSLPSGGQKTAM
jgi:hypothetical protein